MRILLLTHNLAGQGGSYQRAWGLGRALAGRGNEVWLMAGRAGVGLRPRQSPQGGLRILEAPDLLPRRIRHGGLSPMDLAGRLLSGWRLRPDVVHSFDHRPACSVVAWALRRRGKTVWIADWADRWGLAGIAAQRRLPSRVSLGVADHLVERWIYRLADAVTVASRELARQLSQGGRLRGQPLWIPPGANPDLIRPLAQEEARKEQGLALGRPVLCHAGFAGYDEDLLANTFVAVARRIPGVLLLTSGRAGDVLRQVLRAHGLESQWRHMGVVPYHELGSVLSCADVHLLPYRDRPINRGRFPNKLADYMASGRPVVTNPTGDLATLMEGEPFGLLAEESPEAMGSAVVGLLEHPELARAMGRRGRVLAEGRLAWSSLAEEVEQLYTDTAGPAGVEHAR